MTVLQFGCRQPTTFCLLPPTPCCYTTSIRNRRHRLHSLRANDDACEPEAISPLWVVRADRHLGLYDHAKRYDCRGDYQRFLDGLVEAADEWRCPILGGNVKDGPEFTATGTAIGSVQADLILRRTGARPGDKICVIGHMGLFWAAALERLSSRRIRVSESSAEQLKHALYRPIPRNREAQILAQAGVVSSCTDASDGVGASLAKLADANGLDAIVDADRLVPDRRAVEVAEQLDIEPIRLALAWGNWELVCTVPAAAVDEAVRLSKVHEFPLKVVGGMIEGSGRVRMSSNLRQTMTTFAHPNDSVVRRTSLYRIPRAMSTG